jgi:hypothetical protein
LSRSHGAPCILDKSCESIFLDDSRPSCLEYLSAAGISGTRTANLCFFPFSSPLSHLVNCETFFESDSSILNQSSQPTEFRLESIS